MEVKLKLKFIDGHSLHRMIDLLREIDCPMKDVKCKECLYYESCLKLRYITLKLESVVVYEE